MRNFEHVIDTKAIKKTLTSIPDYWVVRDLSERDYGIDLMMEIFSEKGVDDNDNPKYDSTGQVCYLQVKGTSKEIAINDDDTISFTVKKKLLLYVEKFPIPFILVRAFVNSHSNNVYFIWLQRYIMEVIDVNNPGWRTGGQQNFTIRIPVSNKMDTNHSKIEKMSIRIKYIEEYSEFHSRFAHIIQALKSLIGGRVVTDFNYFITELRRIKNLKTLMNNNNCSINESNIDVLINVFVDYQTNMGSLNSLDDIYDWYNLDLLYHENDMRNITEGLFAENEGETTY